MINRSQDEIIQKWPKDWANPTVSVRCITYNQEAYIAQALDSFLMQETTFPFEIVVHDDASTDRTADIIREYEKKFPKILKPIYETENQYSKRDGSLNRIVNEACKGKYIAYCEGDDCWCYPKKLQQQIDFLERNNDYTMVYTNFNTIDERNCIILRPEYESLKKMSKSGDLLFSLLKKNFILTPTICIRRDVLFSEIYQNCPERGLDYAIFCSAAALGKIWYIPQITSNYRKNHTGMMSSRSKSVRLSYEKVHYYFIKYYFEVTKKEKISILTLIPLFIQTAKMYIVAPQKYWILAKKNRAFLLFLFPGILARILEMIKYKSKKVPRILKKFIQHIN